MDFTKASNDLDAEDKRRFNEIQQNLIENKESAIFKRSRIFAYICFFFLGIGSLLPFYAFITANAYYASKFCGTVFEDSFSSFISMFYNASQPIGLLYTIKHKNFLTTKAQVIYPLIVYSILFALTTLFVLTPDVKGNLLFAITLIYAFCCGLAGAVGGLFGLTGTLPPVTTSAIMNGQAFAGFMIGIVNMITAASSENTFTCADDDTNSTNADDSSTCDSTGIDFGSFTFFLFSTCILVLCIALYYFMMRLEYILFHTQANRSKTISVIDTDNEATNRLHDLLSAANNKYDKNAAQIQSVNQTSPDSRTNSNNTQNSHTYSQNTLNSTTSRINSRYIDDVVEMSEVSGGLSAVLAYTNSGAVNLDSVGQTNAGAADGNHISWPKIMSILYIIRVPAFSVFVTFTSSMSVYPALLVLVRSQQYCKSDSRFYTDLFTSFLFLVYPCGDFVGRISAEFFKSQTLITANNIYIPACLRLILILMLFFCDINGTQLPVLFPYDELVVCVVILLGLSNGYLANLSMMLGPSLIVSERNKAKNRISTDHGPHQAHSELDTPLINSAQDTTDLSSDMSLAGTIMVFFLSFGLCFGSALSFVVLLIVTGSVV